MWRLSGDWFDSCCSYPNFAECRDGRESVQRWCCEIFLTWIIPTVKRLITDLEISWSKAIDFFINCFCIASSQNRPFDFTRLCHLARFFFIKWLSVIIGEFHLNWAVGVYQFLVGNVNWNAPWSQSSDSERQRNPTSKMVVTFIHLSESFSYTLFIITYLFSGFHWFGCKHGTVHPASMDVLLQCSCAHNTA